MKVILGCLLLLAGTALAAGQMLSDARPIPRPVPESSENTEQSPVDVAAAAERPGPSQAVPGDSEPPALTLSGGLDSNLENPQPNATVNDHVQSAFPDPVATTDKRQQRRTNVRARVESRPPRHCAYLGCPGVTIAGIAF